MNKILFSDTKSYDPKGKPRTNIKHREIIIGDKPICSGDMKGN